MYADDSEDIGANAGLCDLMAEVLNGLLVAKTEEDLFDRLWLGAIDYKFFVHPDKHMPFVDVLAADCHYEVGRTHQHLHVFQFTNSIFRLFQKLLVWNAVEV